MRSMRPFGKGTAKQSFVIWSMKLCCDHLGDIAIVEYVWWLPLFVNALRPSTLLANPPLLPRYFVSSKVLVLLFIPMHRLQVTAEWCLSKSYIQMLSRNSHKCHSLWTN